MRLFFKSLIIALTTAFDVEFEVTDEFLLEIEEGIKVKRPKKAGGYASGTDG